MESWCFILWITGASVPSETTQMKFFSLKLPKLSNLAHMYPPPPPPWEDCISVFISPRRADSSTFSAPSSWMAAVAEGAGVQWLWGGLTLGRAWEAADVCVGQDVCKKQRWILFFRPQQLELSHSYGFSCKTHTRTRTHTHTHCQPQPPLITSLPTPLAYKRTNWHAHIAGKTVEKTCALDKW